MTAESILPVATAIDGSASSYNVNGVLNVSTIAPGGGVTPDKTLHVPGVSKTAFAEFTGPKEIKVVASRSMPIEGRLHAQLRQGTICIRISFLSA